MDDAVSVGADGNRDLLAGKQNFVVVLVRHKAEIKGRRKEGHKLIPRLPELVLRFRVSRKGEQQRSVIPVFKQQICPYLLAVESGGFVLGGLVENAGYALCQAHEVPQLLVILCVETEMPIGSAAHDLFAFRVEGQHIIAADLVAELLQHLLPQQGGEAPQKACDPAGIILAPGVLLVLRPVQPLPAGFNGGFYRGNGSAVRDRSFIEIEQRTQKRARQKQHECPQQPGGRCEAPHGIGVMAAPAPLLRSGVAFLLHGRKPDDQGQQNRQRDQRQCQGQGARVQPLGIPGCQKGKGERPALFVGGNGTEGTEILLSLNLQQTLAHLHQLRGDAELGRRFIAFLIIRGVGEKGQLAVILPENDDFAAVNIFAPIQNVTDMVFSLQGVHDFFLCRPVDVNAVRRYRLPEDHHRLFRGTWPGTVVRVNCGSIRSLPEAQVSPRSAPARAAHPGGSPSDI